MFPGSSYFRPPNLSMSLMLPVFGFYRSKRSVSFLPGGEEENSMLLALLLFGPPSSHKRYIEWFLVEERLGEEKAEDNMFALFRTLKGGILHVS